MNLDDAIKHCEEIAMDKTNLAQTLWDSKEKARCEECAEEHNQLAQWLIELKMLKTEQQSSGSENPNNCEMRDATPEEREAIEKYIKSISKPTGVKFGALEQEPSDDCISRQAVLNTEYQVKIINDIEYVMLSEVQMKMRKLPSVKPQTGQWIRITNGGAMKQIYLCSVCHRQIEDDGIEALITIKYPYCHCGAKMVEPQETKQPEISSFYGLKSYVRERSDKE